MSKRKQSRRKRNALGKRKALGEQLTNCTLEESEAIIKEIEASTKAMKALEKSYEYNLKEYQKGGKN